MRLRVVTPPLEDTDDPEDEGALGSAGVPGERAPVLGVEEVRLVRRLTVVTLVALECAAGVDVDGDDSKGRFGLGVGSFGLVTPSAPITEQ